MAKILIPTPLRKFTANQALFESQATTVGEAIQDLVTNYPDLKTQLLDANNQVRRFINVFVAEDNIRSLQGEATPVAPEVTISIVPAIAGGIQ
jgi:molybdopterin converting factor small subunit